MDETKEGQDTSQTGDTSEQTKGTSTETKTYTKESEEKAVSDALSAAGRDAKSITDKGAKAEKLLQDAQRVMGEAREQQKKRDEAERESLQGDSEALKSFDERQRQKDERVKLAKERAELDEREQKITEAQKEVAESTKERNAREIATRLDVDYESLIKFTDGSTEAMEELAKQLPKKGDAKSLKTDSGTTIGGTGWRDLSPDEKIRQGTK